jgi:hypothetical protein
MNNFEQIVVKPIDENTAKVYLTLPIFPKPKLLGELHRETKTFRSIKKNHRNLFHLFGLPGIGINVEILSRFNFDFIEVPYNNEVLKTTREYFLKHSIPSPYQTERVDPQRILKIIDFVIPPESEQNSEPTLFDCEVK